MKIYECQNYYLLQLTLTTLVLVLLHRGRENNTILPSPRTVGR